MSWIATSGFQGAWCAPDVFEGLAPHDATLLTRGTLMVEAELQRSSRPDMLLDLRQGGPWPARLCLGRRGEGTVWLYANLGGAEMAAELELTGSALCAGLVRVSFAWDAPQRWGQLAVDLPDVGRVQVFKTPAPAPVRLADIAQFVSDRDSARRHVGLNWFAFADHIAPVGPMPGLSGAAPVATPKGYRPARDLQAGDTVISANGDVVPVLHRAVTVMPALSGFRSVRIRAPFAGLQRDVVVAAHQMVQVQGDEVAYLFGQDRALVPAGLLLASGAAHVTAAQPVAHYVNLVLPNADPILVAGLPMQSLNLGRLHRHPAEHAASLLSDCPRARTPEHGPETLPILDAGQLRALLASRAFAGVARL